MANAGLCFRRRTDDIISCYRENKGLLIVYGAGEWGGVFAKQCSLKIDYFCDRKADEIKSLGGISVIDSKQLEALVAQSGKRATIIICVGLKKNLVSSIYNDLIRLKIDADVFDYFENVNIFHVKSFVFEEQEYPLYENSYNCGYTDSRMTERSVEIVLAQEFLKRCTHEVTEVGAVTPYYFYNDKIADIIDPTDLHQRVNVKKSLFDCNLKGKDVLSISTVEHIGTHDYGMTEKKNAIDAINKIVYESEACLITAPIGYNQLLDAWIQDNRNNPMLKVLKRGMTNDWKEVSVCDVDGVTYGSLWANGLAVIRKL